MRGARAARLEKLGLMTVPQAAELYGVGTGTVYQAIRSGTLRVYTPAGLERPYWVSEQDMDAWVTGGHGKLPSQERWALHS